MPETDQQAPGDDPFFGRMNDPDASAFLVGLCGDEMEFYLVIRDRVIREARSYTDGCPETRLFGGAAARCAVGKTVAPALAISPRTLIDAVPPLRGTDHHCAILAASCLYRALADFLLKP
jgi:nitrogen fixation NifU-like protein